ncbi:hypothetical protein H5410_043145, partial [Solanum commersonii]
DSLALLAGKTQGYRSKPKKFVPPGTICDHCGFKGHFNGDCYRLVGYPPDFQSKRRGSNGFKPDFKPNAHSSKNTDDLTNREKLTENQGLELSHVYSNENVVLDTIVVEPSVCGIEPPEVDTVPDVVTAVIKDSDSLYEGNPILSPDIQ